MSTVIILNGTSSAGKSSLANELQKTLSGNFLNVPIDSFISMIPENSFEDKIDGVVTALGKTVKALADENNNVILDTVLYDPKRRCKELSNELKDHKIIWVKVICTDLEILNAREVARPDRPKGIAESQLAIVYNHYPFDVEIDTAKISVEENTKKIVDCSNL